MKFKTRLALKEVTVAVDSGITLQFERENRDNLTISLRKDMSLYGIFPDKYADVTEIRSILQVTDWEIPDSLREGGKWYSFAKECGYDTITVAGNTIAFVKVGSSNISPIRLEITLREGTFAEKVVKTDPSDYKRKLLISKKEMELLSQL